MIILVTAIVMVGIVAFMWLVKMDIDGDFKSYDKELHIKHFKEVNKK